MRYISFRLDVVKYRLENMREYVNSLSINSESIKSQELLRIILISCTEDIVEIKFFTREYEYVSRITLFLESSTISALLCMQLYIMSKDFFSGYGIYQFWCIATIGLLWLYYWHAEEISQKSNELTNALYSFNWYEVPLPLQKDIALFMGTSMRPITMKSSFINMKLNTFFMVRSAWLNSNDLNRLGPVLGVSIVYINVSIRIIAFYGYKDRYNELLTSIQMGVKHVLGTSLPKEIQIYNRYIKYITRMDYIIVIPFSLTVLSLYLEGIYFLVYQLDDWRTQHQAENSTEGLPRIFYLYSTGSLSNSFFFTFLLPFYMLFVGGCCFFAWPTFNAALMQYVSFRLDVLKYKLKNMSEHVDNLLEKSQFIPKDKFTQKQPDLLKHILVSCAIDLREIRLFTSNYEYVSSVAVFLESSTISALLCVQLYIMSKDFYAGYGLYQIWTIATIAILWLYYWHSNEISYKSNGITNALYSFNWYEMPLSLQKDFAVFMFATMKPITMRSGFIHMNTNSFFMEYVDSFLKNSQPFENQESAQHRATQQRPELFRNILVNCVEDIVEIKFFTREYEYVSRITLFLESSTISGLLCMQLYIISKSNEITNALYFFNWYEVPLSLQKDIAIFMAAAMRPIIIKSGFINMNVNTFFMILKTSYSYFTLLQNFVK
ncbi:odorant receptor 56a-like [Hermetia illucens]|uniref:odorant receptor 56a-like n=1 Tax=Hermetia illucens TaxID=343691 RepID=UPI0018CC2A01|nr:odorant receptor 56a-like [Hermetia illucens]